MWTFEYFEKENLKKVHISVVIFNVKQLTQVNAKEIFFMLFFMLLDPRFLGSNLYVYPLNTVFLGEIKNHIQNPFVYI